MLADFYLLKAHTLITVGQTNKFTFFLHCVCAQKHINLHKSPVFLFRCGHYGFHGHRYQITKKTVEIQQLI